MNYLPIARKKFYALQNPNLHTKHAFLSFALFWSERVIIYACSILGLSLPEVKVMAKITSLHTGHIFRSRRWGGRKFFSSIWGKLFIVLAIRFISSQNNGFLLGVRPRHLWHLLRVSPAKRRQVFGKTKRLANPNYVFITLSRGNNGIASKKKKKFILQYKCKRAANYSQIIKIVVAQRETCLGVNPHRASNNKTTHKVEIQRKKMNETKKEKKYKFLFLCDKTQFFYGKASVSLH